MRKDFASSLPIRRGVSADEAAQYIGISSTLFRSMVSGERMPRARMINGRRVWDVEEIDRSFRALPRDGGDYEESDTWADVAQAS